ncbi:DUF2800 domain-containing protein [Guyparkeria halopsychrophila]|uniref:DUF2800 domain-containing protein n=1 Tax=Guyparkeria halopsychrophila TaxID=3139421 RepID=UPI0037C88401
MTATSPQAHAKLSASGSHRWINCPGSVRMEEGYPDTSGPHAELGTSRHDWAATCLLERRDAEAYLGRVFNGIEATEDDVDYVQSYVDLVRREAEGGELLVEQRVSYSDVIDVPGSFGTSDTVILHSDRITVIDLKYGRGVRVDAPGNSQLRLYALGALEEFGLLGDFREVRTIIHQPRRDHVSEETLSVEALRGHGAGYRIAAQEAQRESAMLVPGESQCRFCKAKADCAARARYVAELTVGDFDDLTGQSPTAPDPDRLTEEQLARIVPNLDLIEDFARSVRSAALERAQRNELPGFKAVRGRRGARQWKDPEAVKEHLAAMRLRKDEMYKLTLQTPTQIAKLLKGHPRRWRRIEEQIHQPEGKPTLAPADDPRPAVTAIASAHEFEDVS